jgi:cytochrome c553
LKAFRGGKRVHEVMSDVAAEMTDADIRAAADWYGAIKLQIAGAE